jgi:hypothetical protein
MEDDDYDIHGYFEQAISWNHRVNELIVLIDENPDYVSRLTCSTCSNYIYLALENDCVDTMRVLFEVGIYDISCRFGSQANGLLRAAIKDGCGEMLTLLLEKTQGEYDIDELLSIDPSKKQEIIDILALNKKNKS